MLTETKINRNVKKKKKLNGRDNCILLCHHRVATESTPKKKKNFRSGSPPRGRMCPARVRGSRPGWRIRPREAVAFFHRSVPGRLSLDRYRKCLHFGQEVGPRRSWEL